MLYLLFIITENVLNRLIIVCPRITNEYDDYTNIFLRMDSVQTLRARLQQDRRVTLSWHFRPNFDLRHM